MSLVPFARVPFWVPILDPMCLPPLEKRHDSAIRPPPPLEVQTFKPGKRLDPPRQVAMRGDLEMSSRKLGRLKVESLRMLSLLDLTRKGIFLV